MLLVPDPASAFVDPFAAAPTLVLICDVRDPVTGESYSRGPPVHRPQGRAVPQEHWDC